MKQAAALPFIVEDGTLRVLLITTRRSGRWTLPKGGIGRGMTAWDSAAREAYEEAGVFGDIARRPLGSFRRIKRKGGQKIVARIDVYPLLVRGQVEDWPEKGIRRVLFVPPETAATMVDEPLVAQAILELASDWTVVLRDAGDAA